MLAGLLLSAVVLAACTRSNDVVENSNALDAAAPTNTADVVERNCPSEELLEAEMKNDPELRKRMAEIETQSQHFIENGDFRLVNGVYEIPVVVNVVYKTNAQNISRAQINSQITVLNRDYSARNGDYDNIPSTFNSVKSGNTNIRFVLDEITRTETDESSFSSNNDVKRASKGGIGPTRPTTKLNIWVCNLSNGLLGYAQFPGGSSSTDGVVIDYESFGTSGTAKSPFDKGRTSTHEIGHWLNLRHIWGNGNCTSDGVGDTPVHNAANRGCPSSGHRSTCTGRPIEMTMNYMDYVDDRCMYMFSVGQKNRMLATFARGGGRNSFARR